MLEARSRHAGASTHLLAPGLKQKQAEPQTLLRPKALKPATLPAQTPQARDPANPYSYGSLFVFLSPEHPRVLEPKTSSPESYHPDVLNFPAHLFIPEPKPCVRASGKLFWTLCHSSRSTSLQEGAGEKCTHPWMIRY